MGFKVRLVECERGKCPCLYRDIQNGTVTKGEKKMGQSPAAR
jgi:hypothetical protein